ncbi:MAG: hypothetical protein K2O33_04685 [Muribaculaceae bacterium]|nr:hypothetical protein [Muribaculaceae bacterium]
MRNIDHDLTRRVADWLNTAPADRDLMDGAAMLFSLDRNRALFNTISRHPEKFHAKLERELRKHLNIRIRNMSVADVVRLEEKVMPQVLETLEYVPVISTDDELPEGKVALGRRPDHDTLPAAVRDLWDSNGDRHRKITLLFNELKGMADAAPCDRFEKLTILAELDAEYRANLARYDSFVPAAPAAAAEAADPATVPGEEAAASIDAGKAVASARKTISKYKKVLESADGDTARVETAVGKISEAVRRALSLGAVFDPKNVDELVSLGVPAGVFSNAG